MADMQLLSGNDAVGWGAILGGCKAFFGYPITPQSEILEFLARELPKAGGVFLQTEDEIAAASMVYGSSMTGTRTMTATSSPGISLMQETVSLMAYMQVPSVIVDVCRFGPGSGTAQTAQTDYRQVTTEAIAVSCWPLPQVRNAVTWYNGHYGWRIDIV